MKYSILYTAKLMLILSLFINLECDSLSENESKTPRESVEFGPFKFETFYNETDLREKLRLGQSYVKINILDKFSPDNLYFSAKLSRLEELVRCDNLTLLNSPEGAQILDCQPIESFLENNSQPQVSTGSDFSNTGGYVKRSSYRMKKKLPKPLPNIIYMNHLYPMKKDLIESGINNILESHNLSSSDFTDLKANLGYYFETYRKIKNSHNDQTVCSGKLLLSINRTETFARSSDDPIPKFVDEVDHLFQQASKNGYLLSLQDINCSNAIVPLALTSSFHIIQRLEFPYLTVGHTIESTPLNILINYMATVEQKINPKISPNGYITTVTIKSRSALFEMLSFNLDQTFLNTDSTTGVEKTVAVFTSGMAEVVSGWSDETFLKKFTLATLNKPVDLKVHSKDMGDLDLIERVIVEFVNRQTSDFIDLNFKIRRGFLSNFFMRDLKTNIGDFLNGFLSSTTTTTESSAATMGDERVRVEL